MTETRFRQAFLLLLVAAISIAFVAMIREFLLTILLAAIFAAVSYPMYRWFLRGVRGRPARGGDRHAADAAHARHRAAARACSAPARTKRCASPRSFGRNSSASCRGRASSTGGCACCPGTTTSSRTGADLHQGRGACRQHQRLHVRRALSDDSRHGRLHLSLRDSALHDVLLPDRRAGAAHRCRMLTCR